MASTKTASVPDSSSSVASPPGIADSSKYVKRVNRQDPVYKLYQQHVHAIWDVDEIDMSTDVKQWTNILNDGERHFIETVLAFFAGADGIVNENLVANFMAESPCQESEFFYGFQIHMENVHAETYTMMLETLVRDDQRRQGLFEALDTTPCIKSKGDWAKKWMGEQSSPGASAPSKQSRRSLAERLVAFAAVEGIFFSASFCSIYWLKKRGLMPGLSLSNELISRDEGLHCDHACVLINRLRDQLSDETIKEIITDAVKVEEQFVREALPVELIGMNSDLMLQYVQFVADWMLQRIGVVEPVYRVKNPFDWMDMLSLQGKTNFFERRVSDYQKASGMIPGSFSMDSDF